MGDDLAWGDDLFRDTGASLGDHREVMSNYPCPDAAGRSGAKRVQRN